ncbi:hypothetical protein HY285_03250 [Candidatus Peregrinibacteria bacterium]|nr:hypothetical protein [Candidatus Peregrinibacteria bacterium]MBI3816533.1 hypothetical protein [Candidatus Peregrinibacteria bacterium]
MRGLVVTWIVNMTDNTDILPAAEQAAPTIAENLLLQTALWDAFQLSIHQQRMKVGKAGKAELSEWMRNTATKLCARLSKASRKKLDELFQITASTPPETPPDSE